MQDKARSLETQLGGDINKNNDIYYKKYLKYKLKYQQKF